MGFPVVVIYVQMKHRVGLDLVRVIVVLDIVAGAALVAKGPRTTLATTDLPHAAQACLVVDEPMGTPYDGRTRHARKVGLVLAERMTDERLAAARHVDDGIARSDDSVPVTQRRPPTTGSGTSCRYAMAFDGLAEVVVFRRQESGIVRAVVPVMWIV